MKTIILAMCSLCLSASVWAAGVDRSQPPKVGEPKTYRPLEPTRFTLSNGLEVLFFEKHGVPLMHLSAMIHTGSADEKKGDEGLATLVAETLDEGAGGRTSLELADEIDYLGADLRVELDEHAILVSLHSTVANFDPASNLFRDLLMRPDFPKKELKRIQTELYNEMLSTYDDPSNVANLFFGKMVYGDAHPYGRWTTRLAVERDNTSVSDLKRFHKAHFVAANTTLVAAGAMKPDTFKGKLEALLGKMPKGKASKSDMPKAKQNGKRRVHLVNKPGAAQSCLRIGYLGIEPDHKDYFPVLVMNTILGGSFSSRMNQNIREEHGYAYGARTRFITRQGRGPFIATSNVQTDVTDKALKEMFSELREISETVSEEEVMRARNYLSLGFPSQFQSVAGIVSYHVNLLHSGQPLSRTAEYAASVQKVTLADVVRVAKEHVKPQKMSVTIVGDRAAIEKGVTSLKLGPMTHYELEEALGPKSR
ncbi:Insulinase family protein [Sulfidibacter corallicola]|uniref:Insulinase family protein n=1 Tax=Sulfidibacter corallicola TaxID=2818388 RepID=A0A8A4TN74_SULCO|nr:pitrilysin family protein [Sulfidibacter corallicola]QTD50887.1 insulinase family protein [Sulfidibacter corallicola]